MLDPEGRISSWNAAAPRLVLGYRRGRDRRPSGSTASIISRSEREAGNPRRSPGRTPPRAAARTKAGGGARATAAFWAHVDYPRAARDDRGPATTTASRRSRAHDATERMPPPGGAAQERGALPTGWWRVPRRAATSLHVGTHIVFLNYGGAEAPRFARCRASHRRQALPRFRPHARYIAAMWSAGGCKDISHPRLEVAVEPVRAHRLTRCRNSTRSSSFARTAPRSPSSMAATRHHAVRG